MSDIIFNSKRVTQDEMLTPPDTGREALPDVYQRLCKILIQFSDLARSAESPLRFPLPKDKTENYPLWEKLITLSCRALNINIVLVDSPNPEDFRLAEQALAQQIQPLLGQPGSAALQAALSRIPQTASPEADNRHYASEIIRAADGAALRVYVSRPRNRAAIPVIIAMPVGMPFHLIQPWFTYLAQHFFVLTWESRGMLDHTLRQEIAQYDFASQVSDLLTVQSHFGLVKPHVMGICGGAVISLGMAARYPDLIASQSLWYGDYNFNDPELYTPYQQNLSWMMDTASEGEDSAEMIYTLFNSGNMLEKMPAALHSALLCPYVDLGNFRRFAALNGSLMAQDIASLASQQTIPTHIVSSLSDQTAHPGGSQRLAQSVPGAELHMQTQGDHLSFYQPTAELLNIATQAIRGY